MRGQGRTLMTRVGSKGLAIMEIWADIAGIKSSFVCMLGE